MKNIKHSLLVAICALVSTSSMANLIQPIISTTEESPVRVNAGVKGGFQSVQNEKAQDGIGSGNVGIGVGFVHNVGMDFEYGVAISGDYANRAMRASIASERLDAKDTIGFRMDAALMGRYMPELADGFRLGGMVELGWGRQLSNTKDYYDQLGSAGEFSLRVGPSMSYSFTDSLAMYTAVNYTLTNIRFGGTADEANKKWMNNHHGVAMPIGFWFAATESLGVFVEADPRITNFSHKDRLSDTTSNAMKSFGVDATVGITFAI